ncbi:MAG: FAD-dependent oxidoreductase [Cyanobacteria bacterium J06554_11]
MMLQMLQTVVLGASPAGLSAAYELARHSRRATVLESSNYVGGLARTERHQDCYIDIGWGSLSKQQEQPGQPDSVQRLWNELAGEAQVNVKVRSRIYYRHRLFEYPLSFTNALKHLGPIDTSLAGLSYLKHHFVAQQRPGQEPQTAQEWVNNQFGPHLNRIFFDAYLQKVWGQGGQHLAPRCASQPLRQQSQSQQSRSQQNRPSKSLLRATSETLLGGQAPTVQYPERGVGQIWQTCRRRLEAAGSNVFLNTQLVRLEHNNRRISQAIAISENTLQTIPVSDLVSSLPLSELTAYLNAPAEIQHSAQRLQYRHVVQVSLVLATKDLFPEQWLYVHSPDVRVSRIQNFKNWSPAMVASLKVTCLGMTYFCCDRDALWHMNNSELLKLASEELVQLGLLANVEPIQFGTVTRQQSAYPIHTPNTLKHQALVQDYLSRFENLHAVGRCGRHEYGELNACVLSGQQAARNVIDKAPAEAFRDGFQFSRPTSQPTEYVR